MSDSLPPIDWLTRFILLLGMFFYSYVFAWPSPIDGERVPSSPDMAVVSPSIDRPIGGGTAVGNLPTGASLHLIENVEVVVMESYPMQIALNVSGYIPDGCAAPTQVIQSREENTVMVRVFRTLPPDAICAAMAADYNDTIMIEGGFDFGHYTFDVNGVVVEIDL